MQFRHSMGEWEEAYGAGEVAEVAWVLTPEGTFLVAWMAATAEEVVRLRGALALETALRARAAWRVRSIMMGGGVERNRGGREKTK